MNKYLEYLEEESIYIIREAVAEFNNPVFLYSIGKDSSVLLHLILKAFYPLKPNFPLLHIDTGWKFKEMIKFRDEIATKYNLKLIIFQNAVKRRDLTLAETQRAQSKFEKQEKLENWGTKKL